MEEKKLTDEEIVKALENCKNLKGCCFCTLWEEVRKGNHCRDLAIDLIHRLQSENERLNDMKFTQEHCDLYSENEALKQWLKRLNADLEYEKNWGKIQAKQAEKDTAKEILGVILAKEFEKGDYLTDDELHELFKERYGVEVE